jgi:hypothetical protein
MRFSSSCLEATRIGRGAERASLEKNPSIKLSHEPCCEMKKRDEEEGEAVFGTRRAPRFGSFKDAGGMVGEDQLYRSQRGKARLAIQHDVRAALLGTAAGRARILKKLPSSRLIRLERMILIEPRLAQCFFARAQK